ncbi:AAA domain-containing protein [Kribbella yunnanensis]|uniref:AAA domain-containing protein n=1 Tax=Kribbella yunnanensis TaxID=190194 RepID=UPI0031DB1973
MLDDDFDASALRKTTSLIDFLADITDSANRDPVRDVLAPGSRAPERVLWLDERPAGVEVSAHGESEVLLQARPVPIVPFPAVPQELDEFVERTGRGDPNGSVPALQLPPAHSGADRDQAELDAEDEESARRQRIYLDWGTRWKEWAAAERVRAVARKFHEDLEHSAKAMEQRDDEVEFVLALGLVTWRLPDGDLIRRHLLTAPVSLVIERSGAVQVLAPSGRRRLEDRELFEGLPEYRPDRGSAAKEDVVDAVDAFLSAETVDRLKAWMGLGVNTAFEERNRRADADTDSSAGLSFVPAPALLLRPRGRELLAEAYRKIAAELRAPAVDVPVGLAQAVVDTEPAQRHTWLSRQGATQGDVLGDDPLFPLPANDEQERVLRILRRETAVVVQGPPGTGKTHTIANLVSALLARGQRVLVTSQKDQALRVLRDRIPAELRSLCVLLTGGSKDAATELERGLDALSTTLATSDEAGLKSAAARLAGERTALIDRSVSLNRQIAELRDVEQRQFDAVAPWLDPSAYRGSLAEIVRQVNRAADEHSWMPDLPGQAPAQPPLSPAAFTELRLTLAGRTTARRSRPQQRIPAANELASTAELAELIRAEHAAKERVGAVVNPLAHQLAGLSAEELSAVADHLNALLRGVEEVGYSSSSLSKGTWAQQAVDDALADRNAGLWEHLVASADEPNRLLASIRGQNGDQVVDFLQPINIQTLGTARGWLSSGNALLGYLEQGGSFRKLMPSSQQKAARSLLDAVHVDGTEVRTADQLRAVVRRIDAEVGALQLAQRWTESGVPVSEGPVQAVLSEMADNGKTLVAIVQLGVLRNVVRDLLHRQRIVAPLADFASINAAHQAAIEARSGILSRAASAAIHQLRAPLDALVRRPDACPELAGLVAAIEERNSEKYELATAAIEVARNEQSAEQRCVELSAALQAAHPHLLDLLERDAVDPDWDRRDSGAAWAWASAKRFMVAHRNADVERRLAAEFREVEDQLEHVTAQLAAAEATRTCIARLSDDQQRALSTYRTHMSKIGAGHGKKVREIRQAARVAMDKAQGAVPAWVVPLPNLLENLPADRDRFDVVIVDEASQIGIEHLYLLWMAPRIIVVGDDKQCTPGPSALGKLDVVYERNDEYLADIDTDIRRLYTPKSNLYDVLSARSGKAGLIRLREHFRCVPEIITWSSKQFYELGDNGTSGGLIPLREREANTLPPLQVTVVPDAHIEGSGDRRRNRLEATAIVDTLAGCLEDPAYAGKSFGIVVLQSVKGHLQLIERLINERIAADVRQERQIRIGTAPDFQGDERDIVFLSMVVAETPAKATAENYRQSYNVAASRAKDQLWLFSSVALEDLKPGDLRTSLMSYMLQPPSSFGVSPQVEEVSETTRVRPFESLFEQRVFREIRGRGYHVVPQYPIGSRRIDLVVVGDGSRIAIECDGHRWHTSAQDQENDARRDRELGRMRWRTVRIRESEFEFDRDHELAPLWQLLEDQGIRPQAVETPSADWSPVELDDEMAEA